MTALSPSGGHWLYGLFPRLISFFLAFAIAVAVLFGPHWFTGAGGDPRHDYLLLLMWGLAAGFTHGVGFVPHDALLRVLLGPLPAWLFLAGGAWWAFTRALG